MASLPGVGRKTAMRLVLHLLKRSPAEVENFSRAFTELRSHIQYCTRCGNLSDDALCAICTNNRRDHTVICVVEDMRDILALEATHQYNGVYHVLGGVISPMEGVGPADLRIAQLLSRLEAGEVEEVILALSATMEGDSTNFYLYRKLVPFKVKVTTLARGVAVGDQLEYADEITLGRSIRNRTNYEHSLGA